MQVPFPVPGEVRVPLPQRDGTQRVRFLERYFYDRQEFARFDSDLGKFVAVTALGKVDADGWNRDEQLLQYEKAGVDRLWIPFADTTTRQTTTKRPRGRSA
ncbi:hypothetical protein E2320_014186 [Naja naja]|nr:hypothetical protein E2320_014186 [Naja naja]